MSEQAILTRTRAPGRTKRAMEIDRAISAVAELLARASGRVAAAEALRSLDAPTDLLAMRKRTLAEIRVEQRRLLAARERRLKHLTLDCLLRASAAGADIPHPQRIREA